MTRKIDSFLKKVSCVSALIQVQLACFKRIVSNEITFFLIVILNAVKLVLCGYYMKYSSFICLFPILLV